MDSLPSWNLGDLEPYLVNQVHVFFGQIRSMGSEQYTRLAAPGPEDREPDLPPRLLRQAFPGPAKLARLFLQGGLGRCAFNYLCSVDSGCRLGDGVRDILSRHYQQLYRLAVLFGQRHDPRKQALLVFGEEALVIKVPLTGVWPADQPHGHDDDIFLFSV